MTHQYNISGMTCGSCVARVKSELLKLGEVTNAEIQLSAPQATISMVTHISLAQLQAAVSKAGNYTINESEIHPAQMQDATDSLSGLAAYKPVLLIGMFILGTTLLLEAVAGSFDTDRWMSRFMAAFFLVFSFFKFLDLKGFAESYATYDIIGKRWQAWGYIYAFIELLLGLAFLTGFKPVLTNAVTLIVMSLSIIGVLQSVLSNRTIRCACLGAVFNLPMSTVTVIEDGLMILMSGFMLWQML